MGYREFVDAQGVEWRAWETRPRSGANVHRELASGWLSFESDDERRRLSPVPREWDAGSDDDLRRWLARATPVVEAEPVAVGPEEPPGSAGSELSGRTRTVVLRAREVLRSVQETLKRTRHPTPPD